jgi:hypothetical protein
MPPKPFRISEQSKARSLLDMLSETDAAITEGVPADLLKRKQDNLDQQQAIADILTGVNISTEEVKKKLLSWMPISKSYNLNMKRSKTRSARRVHVMHR